MKKYSFDNGRLEIIILMAGIILRWWVLNTLGPHNIDPHFSLIDIFLKSGRFPLASEHNLGFHPPLYYFLAIPFAKLGSAQGVQLFSVIISVINFLVLGSFVRSTSLIQKTSTRIICLMFLAFLPQFVLFGSYISNDSLSFLLGTLCILQAFKYISAPTIQNLLFSGLLLGLGLLTKGTFIAFVPVYFLLICYMKFHKKESNAKSILAVGLFCLVTAGVGSFKFIENKKHIGHTIVHNLDFKPEWMNEQIVPFRHLKSFLNINVLTLVQYPNEVDKIKHSIPLLLYATGWWSQLSESNLVRTRYAPFNWVPRLIYFLGVFPVTLVFLGIVLFLKRFPGALLEKKVALGFFLMNLFLIIGAGLKYQVWSCFQGRLLFPSFLAIVLLFSWGYEYTTLKFRPLQLPLNMTIGMLQLVLGVYWVVELVSAS